MTGCDVSVAVDPEMVEPPPLNVPVTRFLSDHQNVRQYHADVSAEMLLHIPTLVESAFRKVLPLDLTKPRTC